MMRDDDWKKEYEDAYRDVHGRPVWIVSPRGNGWYEIREVIKPLTRNFIGGRFREKQIKEMTKKLRERAGENMRAIQ